MSCSVGTPTGGCTVWCEALCVGAVECRVEVGCDSVCGSSGGGWAVALANGRVLGAVGPQRVLY